MSSKNDLLSMRGVDISPQHTGTNKQKQYQKNKEIKSGASRARCCRVLISAVLKYQGNMMIDIELVQLVLTHSW
jgi:hypothetical protein